MRNVKSIINVRDNVLLLYLFNGLFDLLAQIRPLLLLPHLVVNLVNILIGAPFLVLLRHAEHLAIAVPDMFNEVSAVANQATLNGEDDGAGTLVKTKRAACLLELERLLYKYCNC